ncbi:MAG: hypothetical protein ACPGXJ_09220, partial [Pseudomonadales bacterium]
MQIIPIWLQKMAPFFRKISRIEKFFTLEDTCLADCLVRHWHCVTPAEIDTRVPQKLHNN